jgi:hypothetical protein
MHIISEGQLATKKKSELMKLARKAFVNCNSHKFEAI